jgi:hypothetical protein
VFPPIGAMLSISQQICDTMVCWLENIANVGTSYVKIWVII